MAASNAQRFLEKNGTDLELAMEMFWGMVWEAYVQKTVLWNTVGPAGVGADSFMDSVVAGKVVDSGKSWQHVIISADDNPRSHTPGTELLGQQFELDEGTITIDDIIVKDYDVPIDHLLHAHFDVLQPLAMKVARILATNFDKRGFITAVNAALTAAVTKNGMTMHNGGNVVERVAAGEAAAYPVTPTGAKNFRDDVEHLAYLMDVDGVPEEGRYLIYDSYIRRVLQQDTTIFDMRYTREQRNSLNNRVIAEIAGFMILPPTNHIPQSNITGTSLVSSGTLPSKYQGDFTYDGSDDGLPVAVALCGNSEGTPALGYVAAGIEQLNPIYTYLGFDERRNTFFVKGQMMCGWDTLCPPSAGAILVDDA